MKVESSEQSFPLLGAAVAISVVLAFPIEQVTHQGYSLLSYSPHSCSDAEIGLNLGNIAQAILTPILIFLLPGPGSIFLKKAPYRRPARADAPAASTISPGRSKAAVAVVLLALCLGMLLSSSLFLKFWIYHPGAPSPLTSAPVTGAAVLALQIGQSTLSLLGIGAAIYLLRLNISWEPASFIAAGWLCAALIPVAWWYGLREYLTIHTKCAELYDWSLPVHHFQPDYVSDFYHYFIYLTVFSAFWVGIIAGALRLQSARAAGSASVGKELRQFQSYYWACFLGWAVQYRISQWFAIGGAYHNQLWVGLAALNFCFVTVSSLWVLPFTHSLWKKKPRTWLQAFLRPFWRSFLVYLLTVLTFFWLTIYAVLPLVPAIVTWYVFGLAWAVAIGIWRWRALQEERRLPPAPQTPVRPSIPLA